MGFKLLHVCAVLILFGLIDRTNAGFHSWNDTVYFFQEPSDTNLTWHQAISYCESLGMHLVTIETLEENEKIKNLIIENYVFYDFWLGGTDEEGEGRWTWKYGDRRIQYFDWYITEPSSQENENYLVMKHDNGSSFGWYDTFEENLHFQLAICESNFDPTSTPSAIG